MTGTVGGEEAMKVNMVSRDDQVVHLACRGSVTVLSMADAGALLEGVAGPDCFRRTVLLDLSRADYLDSSGVSWLVVLHKRFTEGGGRLVLHSLPPWIQDVFRLLRLSSVLNVAADESSARALAAGAKG